jgi:hypothetical protein
MATAAESVVDIVKAALDEIVGEKPPKDGEALRLRLADRFPAERMATFLGLTPLDLLQGFTVGQFLALLKEP